MDDFEVILVNSEVGLHQKTTDEVCEEISQHLDDCLFVGFSVMTGYGIIESLAVSDFVHNHSQTTKVVWGGWHPSLLAEQTLLAPEIDFVVVGQGEHTVAELAHSLHRGDSEFSSIQGLGWKKDGRAVFNPARPLSNISDFPELPFQFLEDAFFDTTPDERTTAFVTSVGCPLDCGFCADRAVYGGKWNRLSAERTLKEFKNLRDTYGVTGVRILDSNFFVHWPRGIEILSGMRDLGMRAVWVNARIPRLLKAKKEHLELFRDTVDFFLVGAESGSEETLKLITKLQTVDDIKNLAHMYAEYDIPICFSTLVGVPYEDPRMWKKEFSETLDLMDHVLRAGNFLHTSQMHVYTPYPGTPLYKDAVAQGFEPPTSLRGWADVELFTPKLPYLPKGLGQRTEFITAYILQLMRTDYQFYRGQNPLAKVAFSIVQFALTTIFRLRWRLKFFEYPIEMKLIRMVLKEKESTAGA